MSGDQKPQRTKTIVVLVAVALIAGIFAMVAASSHKAHKPRDITTSQFLDAVKDDEVASAKIMPRSQQVEGTLSGEDEKFRASYSKDPSDLLEAAGVPFEVETSSSSHMSMFVLFAVIGFVGILILFSRSRMAASKGANGAPGRMVEAGEIPVSFADVAGCDEVVQELAEIKDFLAEPERFRRLGASIPKGVLLFGPPGTGKTLLARAVAGEAGVPFFSMSGSDFVEMYVGVGASRVRKLFQAAKEKGPCVIFIDEIDAVGRKRGGSNAGGQEERENTLNQLLVEIDGFSPSDNVILMAASNRQDMLDPALTRPGRFDRQIVVDIPDRPGRRQILDVHGKGKPFSEDVDLDSVAGQTAGFSGADLQNLVNEAALLAARSDHDHISNDDIEEAIMRVMAGPQKSRAMTDREKLVTAAHEMGHAIVANELPGAEPVHKVTIVGRGRALGLTVMLQEGDKLLRTRSELMAQMAVALGGRVAEELMFGEVTTGASNDLEKVNSVAQAMVLKLGMAEDFALRAYVADDQLCAHSDELRERIDKEIDVLVTEARLTAVEILTQKRAVLDQLTDILIDRETIDRTEFELLMSDDVAQSETDAA